MYSSGNQRATKSVHHGFALIDGNMIAKVKVYDADNVCVDSAWGKTGEVLAWLDAKGYPPLSE